MNAAILTLTKMFNYGNSLQNYAVQKVLEQNGITAETIMYDFHKLNFIQMIKMIIKNPGNYKKRLNFFTFERKYLRKSLSRNLIHYDSNIDIKYDYFFIGSDQVWNTCWYKNYPFMKDAYLATFTSGSKRIALSASFGIDYILNEWQEHFYIHLNDFKAISVREEEGARIVKKLTGREATVLVDPTMLITNTEWEKVAKKPKGAKEGYILTYFLSPKCVEVNELLKKEKGGRRVYELLNQNDKISRAAGPSEFLWLFAHADLILTDSFHACVFSFLFNKPFVVFDRNWNGGNMNSRLDTLLSKFNLERKYANSGLDNDIWEHNYEDGYKQLEIERMKAIDFLKNALE